MGQWEDDKPGDRIIVETIARRPYDEVVSDYIVISGAPDTPLRKIGTRWRLISHEEAWELLSSYLTRDDLNRFRDVAVRTFAEASPRFDLPLDERYLANIRGKTLSHSEVVRAGLSRTLGLMGSRPEHTEAGADTQALANHIVDRILEQANDWRLWATLGSELTAFAEAAPEVVLDRIEDMLELRAASFR